jgi:hypothetical protein
VNDQSKTPAERARDEKNLERIAKDTPGAKEVAAKVTGTSEETAALFDSGKRLGDEPGEPPSR